MSEKVVRGQQRVQEQAPVDAELVGAAGRATIPRILWNEDVDSKRVAEPMSCFIEDADIFSVGVTVDEEA